MKQTATGILLPTSVTPQYRNAHKRGIPLEAARDPRAAWIAWLSPRFADNGSCYFTGTYSDDYGFPHGLMLPRNVQRDFTRFLADERLDARDYIIGVERHQWRDILHLHAVVRGPFEDIDRAILKAAWAANRGHARVLPVTDGCESYVTKYALKGDAEAFDWRLA